jgi:replicative DNA helicase
MIYNYELEKQLLAALIKEPESYSEVANFISSKDFYSEDSNLHGTIFTIIKQSIDSSEEIDEVIFENAHFDECSEFEDDIYATAEELNEDNFYVPDQSEYVTSEEMEIDESDIIEVDAAGLWENIRKKKEGLSNLWIQ